MNSDAENWMELPDSGPYLLAIKQHDFRGILQQIPEDMRLCKIIVSVARGISAAAKICHLTPNQQSIAAVIAFMALLPEAHSGKRMPLHMSYEFLDLFGFEERQELDLAFFQRLLEVVKGTAETATQSISIRRAPRDFAFATCVHQEELQKGENRYVIIHEHAKQSDITRAMWSAVYGLNYEQIEFMVTHHHGAFDTQVVSSRPDVWRQIVRAWSLHATNKLPEVQAWGWHLSAK